MNGIYVIAKEGNDGSGLKAYAKLWYNDSTIIFDSYEQADEFIKQFPIFFEGIDYEIFEDTEFEIFPSDVFYSDLLNDEEFLYQKDNIKSKYTIKCSDGTFAGIYGRTIIFESIDEIMEFMNLATSFFTESKYEIVDDTTQLIWCFFIDYSRLNFSSDNEETNTTENNITS